RLADARSMAIRQGKPVRFAFLPGSGRFQIAGDDDPAWETTASTDPLDSDTVIRGQLLTDVVFGTDANSISGSDSPSPGAGWNTAAVFLPEGGSRGPFNVDGTSTDDSVFYFGKGGLSPLAVELKGLTASARIYDPGDGQ